MGIANSRLAWVAQGVSGCWFSTRFRHLRARSANFSRAESPRTSSAGLEHPGRVAGIGKCPAPFHLRERRVVTFDPGPGGRHASQGQIVTGLPTRLDELAPRRPAPPSISGIECLQLGFQTGRETLRLVELPFQTRFVVFDRTRFPVAPPNRSGLSRGLDQSPPSPVRLDQRVVSRPRQIIGLVSGHGRRIVDARPGERPETGRRVARARRRERERAKARVDRLPIGLPARQVQDLGLERFGALPNRPQSFDLNQFPKAICASRTAPAPRSRRAVIPCLRKRATSSSTRWSSSPASSRGHNDQHSPVFLCRPPVRSARPPRRWPPNVCSSPPGSSPNEAAASTSSAAVGRRLGGEKLGPSRQRCRAR